MDNLTPEQHDHLTALTQRFMRDVTAKYTKGVIEHGGNLWEKPGLIHMAKEEVLDLWVYLDTLEHQLLEGHDENL